MAESAISGADTTFPADGVTVGFGAALGVGVGVALGFGAGVAVGTGVGVGVGAGVGVAVGFGAGVAVVAGVGVAVGCRLTHGVLPDGGEGLGWNAMTEPPAVALTVLPP